MLFLTNIDMDGNELQNVTIHNLDTKPSNPKAGQIIYDNTTNKIEYYNGIEWISKDDLTIQKLETSEEGYSTSYQMTKNGSPIGDKINIPRDLVVQSGSVKTVESENTPVEGYMVGDKYIDLLIANSNDEHIYILVSDLVEGVGEYYFVDNVKKGEIFNNYKLNKATGTHSHAEGNNSAASGGYAHAEGGSTASGLYSHAEGSGSTASGGYSHAEGRSTASGLYSHAGGYMTIAAGAQSHAEGNFSVASGSNSHAEGRFAVAKGNYSHAEGGGSNSSPNITKDDDGNITDVTGSHMASGDYSHIEGHNCIASGSSSHAEGTGTKAIGSSSHAGGSYTIASGEAQTVIGKYNVEDTENKYAFIIGNGDSSTRSNVLSVSWDGSLVINNVKSVLDTTLIEGLKYQIGELTEDITITLPESANSDIEVDFAVGSTIYNITCSCLSLNVVNNTYYKVLFSYDKTLNMWFSSVLSFNYTPPVGEENSENNESESDINDGSTT